MPDELKEILISLPLTLCKDMYDSEYMALDFEITTIPDPEIGNGPMKISKWLLDTYKDLRHGEKILLTNYKLS